MRVLDNVVAGVASGGVILDLQSVRPGPVVVVGEKAVGEIDATAFFERADANNAVFERRPDLVLEAVDLHDVWIRADSGAELAEWLATKETQPPPELIVALAAANGPCARRERCRTRRYVVR